MTFTQKLIQFPQVLMKYFWHYLVKIPQRYSTKDLFSTIFLQNTEVIEGFNDWSQSPASTPHPYSVGYVSFEIGVKTLHYPLPRSMHHDGEVSQI